MTRLPDQLLACASDSVEQSFRQIVEQMPVLVWATDNRLRITGHWGPKQAPSRANSEDGPELTVYEYFSCSAPEATPIAQHLAALRGTSSRFEYENRGRVLDVSLGPLRDGKGQIVGCIGTGIDITERKKAEEHMRYLATHDPLTGLANYRHFIESLEAEFKRSQRTGRPFALLLMDVDDLKRINDVLGHLAGNRALTRFAEVLRQHCRSTDLAARYGGDEFALLLIEADTAMAEQVCIRVEEYLAEDTQEPSLTVSIGHATFPDGGDSVKAMLKGADRRLYRCKTERRRRSATASP
jgi:diguanylate cyclase (GGDEF)-like protein